MDKMKMQDAQLMQASGVTTSTDDDWNTVTVTTPATNSSSSQGTASQGQRDHLRRACRSTRMEPFIPTTMCKPASTCMIGSSLIHVYQSISFAIDPMCVMCTELTLHYHSQQMQE